MVLAEVDRVKAQVSGAKPKPAPVAAPAPKSDSHTCPHCSAHFETALKFRGECGKPMQAVKA